MPEYDIKALDAEAFGAKPAAAPVPTSAPVYPEYQQPEDKYDIKALDAEAFAPHKAQPAPVQTAPTAPENLAPAIAVGAFQDKNKAAQLDKIRHELKTLSVPDEPVTEFNLAEAERRAEAARMDHALRKAPATAKWYQDAIKDGQTPYDAEHMAAIEQAYAATKSPGFQQNLETMLSQTAGARAVGGKVARSFLYDLASGVYDTLGGAADWLAAPGAVIKQIESAVKKGAPEWLPALGTLVRSATKDLSGNPASAFVQDANTPITRSALPEPAQTMGDFLHDYARRYNYPMPQGDSTQDTAERYIRQGVQSLGGMLMPTYYGAARSATGATAEEVTRIVSALAAVPAGGQAFSQDYADTGDASRAVLHGIYDTAFNYLFELTGGNKVLFDRAKWNQGLTRATLEVLSREVPTEELTTLGEQVDQWVLQNPDKSFDQFISELPDAAASTLVATLIGSGGQIAMVRGMEHLGNLARVHQDTSAKADAMAQTFNLAAQSAQLAANPDTFAQVFSHIAGDDAVSIDRSVLVGAMQKAGVSTDTLPSLTEQQAPGEVVIPVKELVPALAGTGAETEVIPHLRLSPDAPTLAEVQADAGRAMELFTEEGKKALAKHAENSRFQGELDAIQADLTHQLTARNAFSPQRNNSAAQLATAFYATLADTLGVTPLQVRDGYVDAKGVEHPGYRLSIAGLEGNGSEGFSQPAYHGSPYNFDKFSLEHLGKGEGAQAFGWGLYFAGDKAVAEYYRKSLAGEVQWRNGADAGQYHRLTLNVAKNYLDLANGDIEKAIAKLHKDTKAMGEDTLAQQFNDAAAALKNGDIEKAGQLYKVDIPSDETMLYWDKPLSEQPHIMELLGVPAEKSNMPNRINAGMSGMEVYRALANGRTNRGVEPTAEAASKYLHSLGINGIRYLDANSRGAGIKSHNYVIFDDKAVNILEKFYQTKPFNGPERAATALPADTTELKVDGKTRPAQNSLGQPIHWSEEGVRNFWKWFGDSKTVDEQGRPLVQYHGTTADLEAFDPMRANPENDMGQGFYTSNNVKDINANYAGLGPDLKARIEREAERRMELSEQYPTKAVDYEARLAELRTQVIQEMMPNAGNVMPVYLALQNPVKIGGPNETHLSVNQEYDANGDPLGEPTGSLIDFIDALQMAAAGFDEGSVEDAISKLYEAALDYVDVPASKVVDILNNDENFNYYFNETNHLVSHEIMRRAFDYIGFDGIIDNTVNKKFGTQRQHGQPMAGVDANTVHTIAFMPQQIKSAVGNSGAFDANTEQMLYQTMPATNMKELAHTIRSIKEADSAAGTAVHENATAALASALARRLGLSKTARSNIALAALAHDVGKVVIPEEVLMAKRSLTPEEFNLVKTHPTVGHDILIAHGIPERIAEIVQHHHRGYLGGGYPTEGGPVSFSAQIVHVADVVSAVGMPDPGHPYVENAGLDKAIKILDDPAKFSPEIVSALKDLIAENKMPKAFRTDNVLHQGGPLPTQNLVALHNLTSENLLHAEALGGIPVPSIGITKVDAPFSGFGGITLIGSRNMVDPKTGTPVFDSDAYSSRFPELNWKPVKSAVAGKFLAEFSKAIDDTEDRGMGYSQVWDALRNYPSRDKAVDALEHSRFGMLAFLRGKGYDFTMPKREVPMAAHAREYLRDPAVVSAWNRLGDKLEAMSYDERKGSPEYRELSDAVYGAIDRQGADKDARVRKLLSEAMRDRILDEDGLLTFRGYEALGRDIGNVDKIESDRLSASSMLQDEVKKYGDEFHQWAKDQIAPLFEAPTIKVGGKNVPVTLENIVKSMTKGQVRGQEKTITYGSGQARAGMAKRYKSIREIQADRDRIVPPEVHEAAKKSTEPKLEDYRTLALEDYAVKNWKGDVDVWEGLDDSMRALADLGKKTNPTEEDALRSLKKFNFDPARENTELFGKMIDAAKAMRDTPVDYFEAKPQRGVALKEFLGAVIPNDTPQETRDALERNGIQALEYQSGNEAARRAAIYSLAQSLNAEMGGILFQGEQLGAFNPRTLEMSILAEGNFSTFVHELGHFFLTTYMDVAAQPGAPARVVNDVDTLLNQFNVPDLPTWQAMSLEQQRTHHEQFAESFEQYVFTGKAPTVQLEPLFRRMAKWLKQIYVSVKDFVRGHPNAKLNPDLSAIMDRMLATDEQIRLAEERRGYQALFKDAAEAGMTPAEWAKYQAMPEDAQAEADDVLRARHMRDLKWARNLQNKTVKALQDEAKDARAAVRAEVQAEVEAQPVYQAMRWLKRGETVDATTGEVMPGTGSKLSIPALHEMYDGTPMGSFGLAPARWEALGRGKYGMLSNTGVHPDQVAEQFGYPSGDALVQALLSAPKMADEVEGITDQRMLERHGDLFDADAIAKAADEAIHNDVHARMLATEMAALASRYGSPAVLLKAAKDYARALVGKQTVGKLSPEQFAAEASRADRRAKKALAKGDTREAAEQKRQELVNFVAAREAYDAQREATKLVDRMRKIAGYKDDASAMKSRDADVANTARAILAEFGFGGERAGEKARKYVKLVESYDPAMGAVLSDIYDTAAEDAKDWKKLTVSELRDLAESVNNIWFLAKRSRQVQVDGKVVALEDVTNQLRARMEDIGIPDRVPGEGHGITPREELGLKFATLKAILERVESWVVRMDGMEEFGPFRRYIHSPVQDGVNAYNTDKAAFLKRYRELLDTVGPSLKRELIDAPELGYVFGKRRGGMGKMELLHALLHTGNESNKRKLLLGYNWASENEDGSLNTGRMVDGRLGWDAFIARMQREGKLTKTDYDFAQGVWDLLDATKPKAQAAHRVVFGRYFEEVAANGFSTPYGDYRGGYIPATVDSDSVQDAALRELANQENENMAYAFPTPARGFTKARVEYNRPLLLDLRLLASHLDKVLLFSNLAVPVADVRRTIMAKPVSQALGRLQPKAIGSMLTPWLNRSAKQIVTTHDPGFEGIDRFWTVARSRTGMAAMFGNFTNTVQQITGLATAMATVPAGDAKYFLHALGHMISSPVEFYKNVTELSPYMKERMHSEVVLMGDAIDNILVNPTVLQSAVRWTNMHAYFMQQATDNATSPVVWHAAYSRALDKGLSVEDAVRLGDAAVRLTQGAQTPSDIATYEAGSPFFRMFTQFTGYFNMLANLQAAQFARLPESMGLRKRVGRGLYVFLMGFMAQAVLSEAIVQAFRGGPDDADKDGEYLDDWLMALFGYGPLRSAAAMFPFAGAAGVAAVNAYNGNSYDDRISTAPAISMIESSLHAPVSLYNAIVEEKSARKAVMDTATLISLTVGVPARAVVKPAGYWADVAQGKVVPTSPLDAVRGTIAGNASPGSKQ